MKTSRMFNRQILLVSLLISSFSVAKAQTSCCEEGSKPKQITLKYTGESCSATNTSQPDSKVGCSGDPASDPMVYIIANNNDDASSGDIWFSGEVALDANFIVDATNAGQTKLTSNTVIHVFSSQNGTEIQTVNFHTSCSVPLILGDQFGSIVLVGMVSPDGTICGPDDPEVSCVRTLTNTESCVGNKTYVLYLEDTTGVRYWLTGASSTYKWQQLSDGTVRVTGDGFTHPSLTGDLFSFDILLSDSTSTAPTGSPKSSYCTTVSTDNWIYFETVSGTVNSAIHGSFSVNRRGPAFQQGKDANTTQAGYGASGWFDMQDGDGFFDVGDVNAMLSETCSTPEVESCCVDGFKPAKITLTYTGEDCSATVTSQSTDKYNCSGNPSFDNLVYIIANDNNSATSGNIWFSGEVALDSSFTLDAGAQGASKLPSNTVIHVFDAQGGTKIQTVNFHTSCSQPINSGDQYGSLQIVGMISETGASCGLPKDPPSDSESCCIDGFKPAKITLTYTGEDCSATVTSQSTDKYNCSGNPSFDNLVYIVANDNNSATSGNIWFSGEVALDSSFTLDAGAQGASKLPSNTVIHVFNTQGGTKIQTVNFHTSCSQPINTGDQYGSLQIVGMISETGASCGLPKDPPSDSESCCVDGFKPKKITLTYTGEDCSATVTSQSTDKYNCSGNPSFDNLVYIIANDNNSATSGNIWFSGEVALDSSFTLDAGAQGATKLPSNTVIHVFDAQGGTKIQTVNFHTSCSQPINTGDQYGSLQIVGMISETGASCGLPKDPPSDSESCCVDGFKPKKITLTYTGEDCSATVTSQSTDKYNCSGNPSFDNLVYIIANDNNSATSGNIWFSGEVALDSSFTLDAGAQGATKLPSNTVIHVFDAQGGTEIQTVNFHTSCSQPINTGDQYGSLEIVGMISETGASCGLPKDPPSEKESCCVSGFKPQTITMMYTGDDCSATSTSQPSDKYNCSGNPAGDTEVFIIANDNNSASSGQIWFSGAVPLNSLFTLDATAQGQTRFPSNTIIHIFNQENGTELQTVNFHTSCSVPLITGDQWGSVKLVKMVSENGATCGSIEGNGLVNLINGYTFYDLNQSAIFDNGEPVIPTMTVLLYADNNCDGEVDGGDTYLDEAVTDANGFYQFSRPWMGGPFELNYGLTSDNHDGEEKADGSMDLGHGDLHLGERIAGLHFKDINVPSGVTITSAYIEFTSYNDESGATAVRINAEDADNGAPLGGSTNNFSSRTKTSAQVDWNLADWTSDTKYNSPDISAIVQELVDRAGWNALNDVSLFVNPLSGTKRRKAVSQDRSALTSPKLIINYDIAGYKECYVTHVDTTTEPDGNSITTYHTEVAEFTSGGNVDSMNNFGFYGELPEGTNLITGTVFADINEDADYADPEFGIANIEVSLYKDVDCDNELSSGDIWMRKTITNDIGFYQFAVDYEPLTSGNTFSISTDNNDSEEKTDGDVDLSHGDLHLNERIVGLRYQNVSIPAGATIQSARLEMVSKNDEDKSAQVRIYAEDVNSSSAFSSSDNDLSSRTTTTASKNWSLNPWTQDIVYNSPDFSNVIQEVVDRGGWSSGNSLSLIVKSVNGSGKRKAYSHDGDPSKVTKLIVTYTINGVNDCYITRIGNVWPAEYEYLTTDSINDQVFTGVDQVDSLNDFGLWGPDAVPVELLNFEAFWSANNAVLRWATASEENNSFFEIQRSTNAVDFVTIGKEYSKASGGNSLSILNYEVSDLYIKDRIEDLVFYRLKQVDYDGTSALSHIVVLAKSTAYPVDELQIYPNPSTDVAFVNFKRNMSTQGTIKILGATGQVVYSELIPQGGAQESIKLDVSHLDRGIYYIQFESNGSFYTKRFVIDRS